MAPLPADRLSPRHPPPARSATATDLTALSAIQNNFGNADAHSPTCAPSYSPQVGVGIGELHGQIGRSSRSSNKDLNEQSPACESDAPFEIRIDWIVGRATIWSLEL